MVVHVIEWECIFEMHVDEVVVVVEVNGWIIWSLVWRILRKILRILWIAPISSFPTLLPRLVEMANAAKEKVCSNYFELNMHNLEIVN